MAMEGPSEPGVLEKGWVTPGHGHSAHLQPCQDPAPHTLSASPAIPAPFNPPNPAGRAEFLPYPGPGGRCSGVCTGGDTLLASEPTKPLSVSGDTMRCSCRGERTESRMGAQHPGRLWVPSGGIRSPRTHLVGPVGGSAACPTAAEGHGHPCWPRDLQGGLGRGWRLRSSDRGGVAPCLPQVWGSSGGKHRSSSLREVPVGRGWSRNDGAEHGKWPGPALLWRLLT